MYGHPAPRVPHYTSSRSSISEVDNTLQTRDKVLRLNLTVSQNRMHHAYDHNNTDREFDVGDLVYLRHQSYRQTSFQRPNCEKLAHRFHGPYRIL